MCAGATQMCTDASGMGDFACIDSSTMDGFPANAAVCNMTMMCPTGYSCWVTMQGATSGKCLQDCMGSGAAGSGGGAAGSGGGAAGSGGGMAGMCPTMGQMCVNADNMGHFACIDPAVMGGIPANAPTCSQTMMCPSGSDCWLTMQGATTGKCLVNCTVMSGGGGSGGAGGAGG